MQPASQPNPQKVLLLRATDILSALNCLNYLIAEEAEDCVKVRQYAMMAQERLQTISELVGAMLWSARPSAA